MIQLNLKSRYALYPLKIFFLILFISVNAQAETPMIRIKTGVSSLTVNAEPIVMEDSLGSMITFQPSILWAIPSFSARLGIHYLQELGGSWGMTPVSGIGLSGYYYIYGVSTSYSLSEDGTYVTKSRAGPYIHAAVTPVNFNLNNPDTQFYVSAFLYDVSAGVGYDYPLTQNLVFSLEYIIRNGINSGSGADKIGYQGSSIMVSFGTSYF